MSSRSPGRKHSGGSTPTSPQRCQLLLHRCISITLRRVCAVPVEPDSAQTRKVADLDMECANDIWMFENGYLLFQGFVQANSRCFWNAPLLEAMRLLQFQGYVSPGVLLVRAGVCALEVLRNAWSRRVLKAPNNYTITSLGDVEECIVSPAPQGHFTPLAEALCWVILELTASGQAAALPAILRALPSAFPSIARPDTSVVYDALAKLGSEQKVYQTARGYFVVTPETRRRRLSSGRSRMSAQAVNGNGSILDDDDGYGDDHVVARTTKATIAAVNSRRSMLMSAEEALVFVYGDMHTIRDGAVTHQCVQTNLADVLCGGNPNDKVVYARNPGPRRSTSMPLERRHSLRLLGSRRSSASLQRSGSVRLLRSEASSISVPEERTDTRTDKKGSLLMRLFRRARRRGQSAPPAPLHGECSDAEMGTGADGLPTFSAQFPPSEWFNPGVAGHMSVGTQTESPLTLNGTPRQPRSRLPGHLHDWPLDVADHMDAPPSRPYTLPRRHRRRDSLVSQSAAEGSPTPRINRRYKSPASSSPATLSRCTSRNSVSHNGRTLPFLGPPTEQGSATTLASTLPPTGLSTSVCPTSTDLLKVPSSKLGLKGLHSSSSRRSTSGMSKSSSGYNSSAGTSLRSTASCSPTHKILTSETNVPRNFNKPLQSPSVSKNNSLTLQVSTTNRSPQANGQDTKPPPEILKATASTSETTTTTTTTTINGVNNTKIYVQQHNSPVHSVITFENRSSHRHPEREISITNGSSQSQEKPKDQNSPGARSKLERPNSLCSPRELIKSGFGNSLSASPRGEFLETSFDRKSPSVETLAKDDCQGQDTIRFSSHKINNHNLNGKRVSSTSSFESLTSAGSLVNSSKDQEYAVEKKITDSVVEMNNSRHNPVVMTAFPKIKESLSYKNILKEVLSNGLDTSLRDSTKNLSNTTPSKVTFGTSNGEEKDIKLAPAENNLETQTDSELVPKSNTSLSDLVPNQELYPFASLSDLSMHFKSITAQKILSGVSINSIDTMVEVNMATAEKQNNCDVTIHTDFGLV